MAWASPARVWYTCPRAAIPRGVLSTGGIGTMCMTRDGQGTTKGPWCCVMGARSPLVVYTEIHMTIMTFASYAMVSDRLKTPTAAMTLPPPSPRLPSQPPLTPPPRPLNMRMRGSSAPLGIADAVRTSRLTAKKCRRRTIASSSKCARRRPGTSTSLGTMGTLECEVRGAKSYG